MIFERKKYLDELIAGRGNGLVKIIQASDDVGSHSCCLTSGIIVSLMAKGTLQFAPFVFSIS